jgi:hypothetical protein
MDGITFTRASNATYMGSVGLLATASSGLPRFDWASTDRTGAGTIASPFVIPLASTSICNGILIEESRQNRLLWCRDATQSGSWTCANVTPLLNQTGIDGVANAASSLTASADGGTCIQTITLASGSRTGSVYLKRLTGTGAVQVSLDGTTWSTVDLSSTEWRRIVLSGTVTNPVVGIKLATNGDAVAMDYGQVEDGAFATSPVLTTTAGATRAAELGTINANIYPVVNFNEVTLFGIARFLYPGSGGGNAILSLKDIYINTGLYLQASASSILINSPSSSAYLILTVSINSIYSIAASLTQKEAIISYNGNYPITNAINNSFSPRLSPSLATVQIGAYNTQYPTNGYISRVSLFPKRMNAKQLQELTR